MLDYQSMSKAFVSGSSHHKKWTDANTGAIGKVVFDVSFGNAMTGMTRECHGGVNLEMVADYRTDLSRGKACSAIMLLIRLSE